MSACNPTCSLGCSHSDNLPVHPRQHSPRSPAPPEGEGNIFCFLLACFSSQFLNNEDLDGVHFNSLVRRAERRKKVLFVFPSVSAGFRKWPATAACLCTQTRWYTVTHVHDGRETPTHARLTLYLSPFRTLLLLTFHYLNSRCILNDTPSIFLPSVHCFSPFLPHFSPVWPSRLLHVHQFYLCLPERSKLKPLGFNPLFRQAYLRENTAKSSRLETLNASRYNMMCAHTCKLNKECLPTIGL